MTRGNVIVLILCSICSLTNLAQGEQDLTCKIRYKGYSSIFFKNEADSLTGKHVATEYAANYPRFRVDQSDEFSDTIEPQSTMVMHRNRASLIMVDEWLKVYVEISGSRTDTVLDVTVKRLDRFRSGKSSQELLKSTTSWDHLQGIGPVIWEVPVPIDQITRQIEILKAKGLNPHSFDQINLEKLRLGEYFIVTRLRLQCTN